MNRLRNKVALITGAAQGLGEAMAVQFAREGATVVVTDINDAKGHEVVGEIKEEGGAALFIHHDVSREDHWRKVISEAMRHYAKLDVLVNNAGVMMEGTVEASKFEDWRWLMSINLDGVFLGTREGIKAMKDHGGSIINLSAVEGLVGDQNQAAYNASKGGVRMLTKSAALYCAREGNHIRVNSIHPGYIWTPMVENYLKERGDLQEERRKLEQQHPGGHFGEAADVAWAAVYLASDESGFVNGTELVIDGGYTAQ